MLPDLSEKFTKALSKGAYIFCGVWVLVFGLYLITAKAGWVTDTVDWQYMITHVDLLSYLNLVQTHVPSLYQFTQLVTYLLYKVFGFNVWAWHLLFITMHAIHATLVFTIARKILVASGTRNGTLIAVAAVLLFTICPHISEVIVWKASFHYLLGGIMSATVLYCLQIFFTTGKSGYSWIAFFVFLCSTFSIETFYLTPWLSLSLILYYRYVLGSPVAIVRKAFRRFFIVQLLLFLLHLVVLYIVTGAHVAHIGDEINQPPVAYLKKAPGYAFHIVFLGRYFPHEFRQTVYAFFSSTAGLLLFYSSLTFLIALAVKRFHRMRQENKPLLLFFLWAMMNLALLGPLWFPEMQLVAYDRYSYLMLPYVYLSLCFLLSKIPSSIFVSVIFTGYCFLNMYFTLKTNRIWQKSTTIVNSLTASFPDPKDKIVVLLNLPENFNGVPMIGSLPVSFFKLRYNVHHKQELTNKFYDVASYNILAPDNGAHVNVINDSTIKVTLNQWGTWWWYRFQGAHSYNNEDFKLDMRDVGHWYELTLHKPADQYLLLYSIGGTWKSVDMSRKEEEQN